MLKKSKFDNTRNTMQEFMPEELPLKIYLNNVIIGKLIEASRELSKLNGIAKIIPNQAILMNALILQEAKDSSEIENIITTHDELFIAQVDEHKITQAAKEVQSYQSALMKGFNLIQQDKVFKNSHILEIQKRLERNNAGFRRQSGTTLQNQEGEIKYIPPQHYDDIVRLMSNLERYINDDSLHDIDPLIKMAIIHYQFESIHPFYDGNGRSGRIVNILYLVYKELLDVPILYLSGYIVKNKALYYKLLQKVRDENAWEEWILYMLESVSQTASSTIRIINEIKNLMANTKHILQTKEPKIYSKDFVESLFIHPYTKIDYIVKRLNISRQTASKYLKICQELRILTCVNIGRNKYYVNIKLFELFKKGID